MKKKTGEYPHLGARVLNEPTGKLGKIISAGRSGKTWFVQVKWDDCDDPRCPESTQAFWLYNRRVPPCFRLDHGDIEERRESLLKAAESPTFTPRPRGWVVLERKVSHHIQTLESRDSISICQARDGVRDGVEITLSLWGLGSETVHAPTKVWALAELRNSKAFAV